MNKDFRGPLPLDDDDFAAIRGAVLAKIERRKPVAAWFALAASVVVAVMSAIIARQPAVAPPRTRPGVIPSVARDLGVREAHRPPTPVPRYARDDKKVRVARHRRTPSHVARIEIHTADPNVRIIWIAN